jgi:hypothetical protein
MDVVKGEKVMETSQEKGARKIAAGANGVDAGTARSTRENQADINIRQRHQGVISARARRRDTGASMSCTQGFRSLTRCVENPSDTENNGYSARMWEAS